MNKIFTGTLYLSVNTFFQQPSGLGGYQFRNALPLFMNQQSLADRVPSMRNGLKAYIVEVSSVTIFNIKLRENRSTIFPVAR